MCDLLALLFLGSIFIRGADRPALQGAKKQRVGIIGQVLRVAIHYDRTLPVLRSE